MRTQSIAAAVLLGTASIAFAAQAPAPKPAAAPPPAARPAPNATAPNPGAPDLDVLHAQVILAQLGFSPGVIDGRKGSTLAGALKGFQSANGLGPSGLIDPPTLAALAQHKDIRPLAVVTLAPADLAGQFVGPLPKKEDEQAKLPCLCYANPLEMLAERYHTTPETLAALNPGAKLAPGTQLKVPNVATDAHGYPDALPADWKATLAGLNVAAGPPAADHLVVDKSDRVLRAYDASDKVIAQFPVTTGSEHDPLPIGRWKINGPSYNPPFHFNPRLFWDAGKSDKAAMLKPGPNGPVGVVWLDLSKEHYGIHGTPEPKNIGKTASHGCIRMTNWDAARLSLMVKPGTPAIFQP